MCATIVEMVVFPWVPPTQMLKELALIACSTSLRFTTLYPFELK
jgi:hypothetical protein